MKLTQTRNTAMKVKELVIGCEEIKFGEEYEGF